MSLIIGLGSNLKDRKNNLFLASDHLSKHFEIIKESRVYQSQAVGYTEQPDFLNQVLEFKLPPILTPSATLKILIEIETCMGRKRSIRMGPRIIDLDLLFFGLRQVNLGHLIVPHPRCFQRSFVVLPLKELPFFATLDLNFNFMDKFDNEATLL